MERVPTVTESGAEAASSLGESDSAYVFDADTAVVELREGRYGATMSPRWRLPPGHLNGGYVLSVCVRALADALPLPDPLVVSAFFERAVLPGPAQLDVEVARTGRRLAFGEARLGQGGRELVRAVASFGDLSALEGPTVIGSAAPDLPPPEACFDIAEDRPDLRQSVANNVEVRYPKMPGWRQRQPSGEHSVELWLRFADGRDADVIALTGLVDMTVPQVFELGPRASSTIELTVHVRSRPAPGWLACRSVTNYICDGLHETDFEIWDSTGRLCAQSRQLALIT